MIRKYLCFLLIPDLLVATQEGDHPTRQAPSKDEKQALSTPFPRPIRDMKEHDGYPIFACSIEYAGLLRGNRQSSWLS